MFDIKKVAREYDLSQEQVEEIKKEVRQEFPRDELMYELHVIRAIMSKGHAY